MPGSCRTVIPSTPGAPLLRTTARNAASMFSGSQTASIRYAVDAGFLGSEVAMTTSASRAIRRGVSPRPGVGKSNSSWDGGRFVVMKRPSYLPFPSTPCGDRSGLRPPKRPTPSADFCTAVRAPCGALSPLGYPRGHDADLWGKPRSLPRTPPDLRSRPLMDMDFATSCPLVRPVLPRIRLLFVRSRFRSTLPSDGPSRFRPCASLVLHLHQVAQGTFTPRLLDMPSTQHASRRLRRWPAALLDRSCPRH